MTRNVSSRTVLSTVTTSCSRKPSLTTLCPVLPERTNRAAVRGPSFLGTLSSTGKLVGLSYLVILKQLLSDRCLCQDLSVSDMEEVEEEQRRSKVEETVEIEHNIVTCSECRELSLTAF